MDDQPQPYEFDETQNKTLGDLGRSMQTVGTLMQIFGIIGVVAGVANFFRGGGISSVGSGLGGLIQSIVLLVFGFWTSRAGTRFGDVVTTRGQDIVLLMGALGDLRKMYGVIRSVIMLAIGFFVASVIVFVVSTLLR
jgi:hypothetical protein